MTFLDITVTIFGIFASKAILHYGDWFYIFLANIGMGHGHDMWLLVVLLYFNFK